MPVGSICEPEHKFPGQAAESLKNRRKSQMPGKLRLSALLPGWPQKQRITAAKDDKRPIFGVFCPRQRKIHEVCGHAAQICCHTICNIGQHLPLRGQLVISENDKD